MTPAAKLLGYWNQTYCWINPPAPKTSVSKTVEPNTAAAAPTGQTANKAPNAAQRVLAAAVQRLRDPTQINGPREALELAVKALHEGVGFRRVAALFVRPPNRELQTVLSAGAEQAPALRQFRFESQNSALLTQLLSKPVCLLIDAETRGKYWRHFPESFRAAIDCDSFAVMTVFANERPIALIYVDNAPQAIVNGSRQHLLFKQLCQQLSQCLGQLR